VFRITSMDLSSGSFSGSAEFPSGGAFSPISGTATGGSVSLTTGPYSDGSGYSATFTGTISADNNSMSGTWQSNASQSGTWTATRTSGGGSAAPVLGRAVNTAPVSGQVLVKLPGQGFAPLSAAQQIPVGSLVDTSRGTVRLTSAVNTRGKVQSGDFSAGVFKVGQSRSGGGLTDLSLSGGSFAGCVSGAGLRAAAARSSRVVRRLRGKARGRFRTRGRYSAATVRGTNWTVEDRCDGTLTRVKTGVVVVNDFRKHRNVTVRAGKSYLAHAG
jgi:hypothetical protein